MSENRRGSRACPPWWVDRRGGTQCPSPPRRFDPDFHLDPPSRRYGFAAAPPAAEVAGSPLPLQPRRGAIPSASSAPKGRHPFCLFSPEGAPSLSPGQRPGYRAYPRFSAPKGRHSWPRGAHGLSVCRPGRAQSRFGFIPRALPWAEEWPRFQRSAASGIRDTSRRKSPPRVK